MDKYHGDKLVPPGFENELNNIAIDFDGVIHDSSKGWHDGTCYGQPLPGSLEAIKNLSKNFNIIIFTARFMGRTNNNYKKAYELGYELTYDQLCKWNLKFDKLILGKPSFDILIDDKAFNYSDKWLEEL